MTTDITELAQRVKTEASAIDDTQWYLAKPSEIRSLVEALEKAQQCAKERDAENQDLMLTVGRLRVEREELESRTVTPVNYSENTDADHCRKWAWQQVKGEVSTEGWTSGDNANYFGFFCWGWDMRRQYNEQRPINVKLPKTMYTEFDDDDYCLEVAVLDKQQVIDCLRAAGAKVEAE